MAAPSVTLRNIPEPERDASLTPIPLSDETMQQRMEKVLKGIRARNLDALAIYADLEHGSNFEYLVGFLPRFEEALLILHNNGRAFLILGNENLNKAGKARLQAEPLHAPIFSLPNQPMRGYFPLTELLAQTGIADKRVGLVGWKNFQLNPEAKRHSYDLPSFIVDAFRIICGNDNLENAADIFIGENGTRTTNNANEIAHYEFGAALASDCMLDALDALEPGVSEFTVADKLRRYGQPNNVVTIAAFGERFIKANMYPTNRKLSRNDTVSLTVGYKGGLSSRAGVAWDENEERSRTYLERSFGPYFATICRYLEVVHCGMVGGELHRFVDTVFPRKDYGWSLCPGHLTADEEWMSSPIYEGSNELLRSGMILQTDIIPSIPGIPGSSIESTFALADENLRHEIASSYPTLWNRIERRRSYISKYVGVALNDDVLPLCSTLLYGRPFMLSRSALVFSR